MSMYTLLRNNAMPTEEEMEKAFEGNYLCVFVCVHVSSVCMHMTASHMYKFVSLIVR